MISRLYQKSDSVDDVEIAPLQPRAGPSSRSSSRSNSFSKKWPSTVSSDAPDSLEQSSSIFLFQQATAVVCLVLVAWYGPRYLIRNETDIRLKQPPYQLLKDGQVIFDPQLNHPLVNPPTIPSNLLVYTSIWIPLLLVAVLSFYSHASNNNTARLHCLHASVCALLTTIALSEGPTQLLKLYIQRKRPNYYALCGFDTLTKTCQNDLEHIREANFSFPSGHSSLAAGSMVCLAWFLAGIMIRRLGQLQQQTNKSSWTTCIMTHTPCLVLTSTTTCLAWALFVGASRIRDSWHHASDVVAGLCLGSVAATMGYHAWHVPIWVPVYGGLSYSVVGGGEGKVTVSKDLMSVHE